MSSHMARFHPFYGWVIFHSVCVHHIFFIYSCPEGHLGCSHILAIVNNAVMNIRVHMFFLICVFVFFRQIPSGLPSGSAVKNPASRPEQERCRLSPASGGSPGEELGTPVQYFCLENPRTEEPGGQESMGSQGAGHDWSNLAHTGKYQGEELLDDMVVLFLFF